MGIRIHKSLGYGFQDMTENDPRINWDQFEYAQEANVEDFNTFLRLSEDSDDIEMILYWRDQNINPKSGLCEYVSYNTESGMDNILQFSHIGMAEWRRYNNSLDYYQAISKGEDGMLPSFDHIPFGIYPYDSKSMTYLPSGQKVKSEYLRIMRDAKTSITMENGDMVDFSSGDEIDKFAPEIPVLVRQLALFFGVDAKYVDNMQSGLYTYWS